MSKRTPAPKLSLAPVDATRAALPQHQARDAMKRYYLDEVMRDWTPQKAADFLMSIEPAVQAAGAYLTSYCKQNHKDGYAWNTYEVDGQVVSGLFVDCRGDEIETFNTARIAKALLLLHRVDNDDLLELLTKCFEALPVRTWNKLVMQGKGSRSNSKPKVPLLEAARKYALDHMNEDGEVMALRPGKPTWAVRQSPPGMAVIEAEGETEEDDE